MNKIIPINSLVGQTNNFGGKNDHNNYVDIELGTPKQKETVVFTSSPSIDMIVSLVLRAISESALLEKRVHALIIKNEDINKIITYFAEAFTKINRWDENNRDHIPSVNSHKTLSDIFRLFVADTNNTVNIKAISKAFDESTANNFLDVCDYYYFNILITLLHNCDQFRNIVKNASIENEDFEKHIIKRINHNKRLLTKDYLIMVEIDGNKIEQNLHNVCVTLLKDIIGTVSHDGFDIDKIGFLKKMPFYRDLLDAQTNVDSLIPYIHDIDTICKHFETSKTDGLTNAQVLLNLEKYGDNVMPQPTLTPLWRIIFNKFIDPMILFLVGFIVFKIIIMNTLEEKSMTELVGIFLTIALVFGTIAVGTKQDYDAERSGKNHKPPQQIAVRRNGNNSIINVDELVVGDLVMITKEGENVPADCRVFDCKNFSTMEAMLTGEPIDVKKNDIILPRGTVISNRKNMCFAGTAVSTGTSSMIVTACGTHTEAGKLVEIIERTKKENMNKKTPLMGSIAKLSYALIFLAIVFCGCIFFVGLGVGYDVIEILGISLSLAASVVPEGLPAILIVTVSIVAKVMRKAQCDIRNNSAVQTIGSVSIVCSDKTGTLTLGKMTARFNDSKYKPECRDEFIKTLLLCNSVDVSKLYVASLKDDTFSCVQDTDGDTTEIAIIKMIQQTFPQMCNHIIENAKRIYTCPFDSNRKRMSVIVMENNLITAYTKGAPEAVMEKCIMSNEEKDMWNSHNTEMTKKGMRVLGISTKKIMISQNDIKNRESDSDALTEYVESNEMFIGIVGIVDPPKEGVKETVHALANADIPVVMITGDHPNTGIAIASELGIFNPVVNTAMTGSEFTAWADSYENSISSEKRELLELFKNVRVFARVTPDEKRMIVKQYQSQDFIVAMLGDGPNDAPAIVEADVGYAMHSGTDLAKDNADVVIIDNKLNSLTGSVEYGRSIYDNVQKFIIYLISCNFAEVFTMLFFVCFGGDLPFNTNMLLWANIFADIPPSIAISYEAPHKNIMTKYPVPKTKKIVSLKLFIFMFLQSLLMTIYTCVAFSSISKSLEYDLTRSRTLAYVVLSSVQLSHSYWCRYPFEYVNSFGSFISTICSSRYINYAVLLSFILMIASIYIPYFNSSIGITELNWVDWLIILCSIVLHGFLMQIVKFIMVIMKVD